MTLTEKILDLARREAILQQPSDFETEAAIAEAAARVLAELAAKILAAEAKGGTR